jgi:hypothetical protein
LFDVSATLAVRCFVFFILTVSLHFQKLGFDKELDWKEI